MTIQRHFLFLTIVLLLAVSIGAQEDTLLLPILQSKKWGYMDRQGRVILPAQFKYALPFSEGLALITMDPPRKLAKGFIDARGIPVSPDYYDAGVFSEGLAPVAFETKQTRPCVDCSVYDWNLHWGFIDKKGRLVIEAGFRNAAVFHDELAAVQGDSGKWGFIDTSGNLVIPYSFDYASFFFEGLAAVMHDRKWGYIDKTGTWAIEPRFTGAHGFHEGKAIVKTGGIPEQKECGLPCPVPSGGEWAILDRKNLTTTSVKAFSILEGFSEGLLPYFSDGNHCGYMDAEGKTVIPSQKGGCSQFSEGLARMETSDGAYYIDHGGNKVLSSPAPEAFDFHNGLARVGEWWEDGGWRGYIDHAGKVVWSSGKLPAKNTRRK